MVYLNNIPVILFVKVRCFFQKPTFFKNKERILWTSSVPAVPTYLISQNYKLLRVQRLSSQVGQHLGRFKVNRNYLEIFDLVPDRD